MKQITAYWIFLICIIILLVWRGSASLFRKTSLNEFEADSSNAPKYGYRVTSIQNKTRGLIATAKMLGNEEYYIKPTSPHVKNLQIIVSYQDNDEFRIRIIDLDNERPEIPDTYPFPYDRDVRPVDNPSYSVEIKENPLGIIIRRKSTNEILFNTDQFDFIYSHYYIELRAQLPTDRLFGLGERMGTKFKLPEGSYTLFPMDSGGKPYDTGLPGYQTYGHHPMYLMQEKSGNFHVVLMRNPSAMDLVLENSFTNRNYLTFKMVTGVVDLKFFLGNKYADTAVKKYHSYLGGWVQNPFWSFGFHQCRYGYKNLTALEWVAGNFSANKLPIDTIWTDIDYMSAYIAFTVNETAFPLQELHDFLNETGLAYVPIIDAGIKIKDNYAYDEGIKRNVFIKNATNEYLVGKVWPGLTHWVDWFHGNASDYWGDMLMHLRELVKFNGIWLDMNEPANFCDGECPDGDQISLVNLNPKYLTFLADQEPNFTANCPKTISDHHHEGNKSKKKEIGHWLSDDLPYVPGTPHIPLERKTLSLNATHANGQLELFTHSLSGMLETAATYRALKEKLGQRFPFIIARSTTVGTNQVGSHWTGDNQATYDSMRASIVGIMDFNLFGIPFTGSDICGFHLNTTAELCARWFQLGALYPFSRNHNDKGAKDQEPYVLGPEVLAASNASLHLRYSLLKHYFSLFILQNGTGSIFKPLFFEYPEGEDVLYENPVLSEQFMIGDSIMVAPALYERQRTVKAFFPSDRWYNLTNGAMMHMNVLKEGIFVDVNAPLVGQVPIFVRGGKTVLLQNTMNVQRSYHLDNKFHLIVALKPVNSQLMQANGYVMGLEDYSNDELVYNRCKINNCFMTIAVKFESQNQVTIEFNSTLQGSKIDPIYLERISLYGARCPDNCNNDAINDELLPAVAIGGQCDGIAPVDIYYEGKSLIIVPGSAILAGPRTIIKCSISPKVTPVTAII